MTESGQYLKTQQVADALGIGVSTLKRWVDAGQLSATRTVGKHRLISLQEALKFARTRELSTTVLERLSGSGLGAIVAVDDQARSSLIAALREGRAWEARRLIEASHAVLGGGAALADELIAPVMQAIGHGWSIGTWDIYQEHQASQIVAATLSDLVARVTRGEDTPGTVALGASPEGDHYTLPALLGELTLRELDWDVKNLGPNLPLKSLTRAVEAHRPRLVFLAVSHLADPIAFIEGFRGLHRAARAVGADVVLGGRGLLHEVRSRLDDHGFGDRMSFLAESGRRLLAEARTSGIVNPRAMDRPGSVLSSIN